MKIKREAKSTIQSWGKGQQGFPISFDRCVPLTQSLLFWAAALAGLFVYLGDEQRLETPWWAYLLWAIFPVLGSVTLWVGLWGSRNMVKKWPEGRPYFKLVYLLSLPVYLLLNFLVWSLSNQRRKKK